MERIVEGAKPHGENSCEDRAFHVFIFVGSGRHGNWQVELLASQMVQERGLLNLLSLTLLPHTCACALSCVTCRISDLCVYSTFLTALSSPSSPLAQSISMCLFMMLQTVGVYQVCGSGRKDKIREILPCIHDRQRLRCSAYHFQDNGSMMEDAE